MKNFLYLLSITLLFSLPALAQYGGVPYAGATGAVDLGAYDLKVNGLTVGKGLGNRANNTAFGNATLRSNISGFSNTANGFEALKSNTNGNYNTAIGTSSLSSNTTGGQNTAVGIESMMSNTTGNGNAAIGRQSLLSNTEGNFNTGLGIDALTGNTTGSYGVGIGQGALGTNKTGRFNTAVGPGADVASGALTNATAIGHGAIVSASNTIRLGNTEVSAIQGQVGFTAVSDSRIKKNVINSNYGLATVLQLRPVEYNLISNDLRQVGFIAQEVQKLVPEVVTGKEGDVSKGEVLGITYSNLVPVLTKAIQEQQKVIEEQNSELQSQKNSISSMQKELEELKKLIKGLEK